MAHTYPVVVYRYDQVWHGSGRSYKRRAARAQRRYGKALVRWVLRGDRFDREDKVVAHTASDCNWKGL